MKHPHDMEEARTLYKLGAIATIGKVKPYKVDVL